MAMRRRVYVPALLLAVIVWMGFGTCTDSTDSTSANSTDSPSANAGVDAVVHYVNLEGGCWTITVDPNHVYQPLSLPAAFQKDGLAVRVDFKQRPDMASFCMVGPLIQILSISPR